MNTWAPLWSFCVESSLWDEPDYVVKVFLTMLAVKDQDNVVRFTAYQIGRKARKTESEVLDALKILSSPDKRRIERQKYEGRRIEAVEDGWLILNGAKYHEMVREEMRKNRLRKAQANHRAKLAGKPLPYPPVKKSKPASDEELAEAHAAVQQKTIAEREAAAAQQEAVQHLDELQGNRGEMPHEYQ